MCSACDAARMQHACGAHDVFRQFVGARDHSQLVVEHSGEREEVVALTFQCRAYRPDAALVIPLAPFHLSDDEVEHLLSDVQARTGQRQDVVGEPCGERSNVAGKRMRSCFGLQGEPNPVGKVRILTCFHGLGLQFFTSRLGPLGDAGQGVGQALALTLNVKHIAMTALVAPGGLLSGAQSLTCIGDRVVGIQTLLRSVEQMNAPEVGVAMFGCGKQIAVGRPGVDTGKHWLAALEYFVVQADTNCRQVLIAVDDAGLLRSRLMHVVNGAIADGYV